MFTYIYSLVNEKDICDRRNVSNKFACICVCISSGDLFFSLSCIIFKLAHKGTVLYSCGTHCFMLGLHCHSRNRNALYHRTTTICINTILYNVSVNNKCQNKMLSSYSSYMQTLDSLFLVASYHVTWYFHLNYV